MLIRLSKKNEKLLQDIGIESNKDINSWIHNQLEHKSDRVEKGVVAIYKKVEEIYNEIKKSNTKQDNDNTVTGRRKLIGADIAYYNKVKEKTGGFKYKEYNNVDGEEYDYIGRMEKGGRGWMIDEYPEMFNINNI